MIFCFGSNDDCKYLPNIDSIRLLFCSTGSTLIKDKFCFSVSNAIVNFSYSSSFPRIKWSSSSSWISFIQELDGILIFSKSTKIVLFSSFVPCRELTAFSALFSFSNVTNAIPFDCPLESWTISTDSIFPTFPKYALIAFTDVNH